MKKEKSDNKDRYVPPEIEKTTLDKMVEANKNGDTMGAFTFYLAHRLERIKKKNG